MRKRVIIVAALSIVAAAPAPVKPGPMPQTVRQYVIELGQECIDFGGKPARSPDLIARADLTGDGLVDYVIDVGAFNCEGAASAMSNGQAGATLSIFVSGPGNMAAKAYTGSVYSHELDTARAVPRLYVGVSGISCGQRNAARLSFAQQAFCMRPLNWVAAQRSFVFAPLSEKRAVPQN